jgi:hypothetical protein
MTARHTAIRRRLDRIESAVRDSAPFVWPIIEWQFIDPETMAIVGSYCPNTGEATGIALGTELDGLIQVRS